jgi:endonuclease/exonuclease/phosphatase family metal-dependent hydrolase
MPRRRTLIAIVGLAVAVAACTDTTATTAPDPPTDTPPTTAAPTATTESAPPTTAPPPPVQIRVLSYNIHYGEGEDDRVDLQRIADVINSVSPDLVGLQEVERGTTRTDGVDQPAVLGQLTGMDHVFGKNIDFRGGGFGNAILSRLPIRSSENVLLPVFDEGEQRGVLVTEVGLPDDGGTVRFLATHLDHRDDPAERLESARQVNALIADLGEGPAILAGDLNDTPGSGPLEILARRWENAAAVELPTFPVDAPEKQIDFILFSGRWRVVAVTVLAEAVASDHRAIFAILELVD